MSHQERTQVVKLEKATLCFQGDFGMQYHVIHCREIEVTLVEYAQYSQAVEVRYTGKGQRSRRGFVQGYKPTVVILEGHVQLDVPDMWGEKKQGAGVSVARARHSACSDGWSQDFDVALAAAVAKGAKVVADFRGHNSYSRKAA